MSARPFTADLEHTLLRAPVGSTEGLGSSCLQDGERMAIWLQIAAVLTLLPLRAPLPLESLRVDEARVVRWGSDGRLRPTTRSVSPQLQLARAGRLLFGRDARGRGRARRVARQLLLRWQQELVDLAPDRLVAEMLEAAPFMWEPRHAAARSSLVVESASGLRVAGPGALRSRVLAGPVTYEEAVGRLASAEAASVVGGLYRLELEMQLHVTEQLVENLGQLRNALAAKLGREPGARIEPAQLGEMLVGDGARAVGRPVEIGVVDHHGMPVATPGQVELDAVGVLAQRTEGRQGVLRRAGALAAVRDESHEERS